MSSTLSNEILRPLRQALASLEPTSGFPLGSEEGAVPLWLPALDAVLAGGLALGAVHEVTSAAPAHLGAAFGFALAIVARALCHAYKSARAAQALWIETDYAVLEGGKPYGTGLDLFGVPMDRLLILRVSRPIEALWAFEEALKSSALAAVITELPETGAAADLTATRRLLLAARAGNGLGLLLRHRSAACSTAAMSRWEVAPAPSKPDRFGGLGRTAFELSLNKNRRGRCGRFIVSWDHESRTFIPQALSVGLAEAACNRPDRAQRLAHAG
jgi:protein ImuA